MTITTVETLSQLSSTAVATYGTMKNDSELKTWLTDANGHANFTETQATEFVARYRFLAQLPNVAFNGFSAAVFEDKQTNKHIIAMRGTELNGLGQAILDGFVTDGLSIGGNGFANNQAVEMYRYYRSLTTPSGQAVQYTEAEKWKLFAVRNSMTVPLSPTLPTLSSEQQSNFDYFKAQLARDVGAPVPAGGSGASVLSPSERVDVTLDADTAIVFDDQPSGAAFDGGDFNLRLVADEPPVTANVGVGKPENREVLGGGGGRNDNDSVFSNGVIAWEAAIALGKTQAGSGQIGDWLDDSRNASNWRNTA